MKSPFVGRGLAVAVMIGVLVWMGVRTISGKPAEPKSALPSATLDETLASSPGKATAVFAGGCFWGTQAVFQHVKGVLRVTSGYSGGTVENPYYELVCSGRTGHAESIRVVYDPSRITYGTLLKVFFAVAHDPTQKNRQGPDIGTQYRSAIFYVTPKQKEIAEAYVAQVNAAQLYPKKIETEIAPYSAFYDAEDYHQNYLAQHLDSAYIQFNDLPKLKRLKAEFPELWNEKAAD